MNFRPFSDLPAPENTEQPSIHLDEYNTLESIYAWLRTLEVSSKFVKIEKYGESFENQDLLNVQIGTGDRVIMIDCGIHAREWIRFET